MSNLPAIAEPQEVQSRALTVEESVEFKLKAFRDLAKELKAQVEKGVPTIAGIGDKETYNKVAEWRKKAQKGRTGLDTHRLGLTEESRKYQALVNSTAKEITKTLEVVEDAFFAEENRIDQLIAADKAAKQKVIDDRVQYRTNALLAVNGISSVRMELLAGMGEENFQAVLKAATTIFEEEKRKADEAAAELARLQAEDAERKRLEEEAKAEAQRLEREALEAQRKSQAEAQAKLDAQMSEIAAAQKKLDDAKAAQKAEEEAKERKAREDKIATEAAENARIEAEAKAKREHAEREAKAEADRLEKIRLADVKRLDDEAKAKAEVLRLAAIEAAKPDAEKLIQFAAVVRGLQLPTMATPKGEDVERLVRVNIENLAKLIDSEAAKLTK